LPAAVARARGDSPLVAIRADRMSVRATAAGEVGASAISGVARSVEYLGATVQVGVEVAGLEPLSALVPEASFDAAPVHPGQPVVVSWKPEDVHVLAH